MPGNIPDFLKRSATDPSAEEQVRAALRDIGIDTSRRGSRALVFQMLGDPERCAEFTRAMDAEVKDAVAYTERVIRGYFNVPATPEKEVVMTAAKKTTAKKPAAKKPAAKKAAVKKDGVTPTVGKALGLMKRAKGATMEQLVTGVPEAKPRYLSALVYRILPGKGIKVERVKEKGKKTVFKIAA